MESTTAVANLQVACPYRVRVDLGFYSRRAPNMKSFSHANNIVLRRVIYIHSLPGLKLVKRFSLANETWCAVTVPPFDFVKGDYVVGNAFLGKKGYKLSTEYKIYSRKSTNLTVVDLSCKTKGKNLS